MIIQADTHHHIATVGKFNRIADDIGQYLLEAQGIAIDAHRHIIIKQHRHAQTFFCGYRRKHIDHIINGVIKVKLMTVKYQLARFNLREIQNIVNQGKQVC